MTDEQKIHFLQEAAKEQAALKERLAELILKNHSIIDYTGFEDVQVVIEKEFERKLFGRKA